MRPPPGSHRLADANHPRAAERRAGTARTVGSKLSLIITSPMPELFRAEAKIFFAGGAIRRLRGRFPRTRWVRPQHSPSDIEESPLPCASFLVPAYWRWPRTLLGQLFAPMPQLVLGNRLKAEFLQIHGHLARSPAGEYLVRLRIRRRLRAIRRTSAGAIRFRFLTLTSPIPPPCLGFRTSSPALK